MTLFNLQNQVVVKVLTLVTMVMMVMSLVPMQVFAEGDAPVDPDAAQTVSAPVVVDPEEGKKIEKKVEEPTLLENLVSTFTFKPDPDEYFCHKAGNSYQKQPLNASNGNGHYGEGHQGHEGDIIPPAGAEGSHNWDAQGQAIWNNNCNMPVAAVSVDDVTELTCDIKNVTIGGEVTIPTSGDSLVVKLDGVIVMDDEAIDDAGPDGVSQDWSYTLTNLSVGSHTVEVIIYDDAVANTGVKASDTTTFEIKACPPPTVSACVDPSSVLTTNLSTWDLSQTRVTGHNAIVDNGLRIWTESNTGTDKAAGYYTTNFPLSGLGNQTIDAALDYSATIGIEPGLQLVVDFDNNGTPDGILVGEKVYGNNWWLSSSSAQQFVKDNAPNNAGGNGSPWFGTPNEWLSKFPNAKVKAIGYSLGSGVYGDGVINEINLGCTKYTFDLPAQEPVNQVKVHILKYLKAGEVTAQIPNDSTAPNFPMTSSWSAANIGTGSGSYVLGNNQGGTALRYAADTSFMDAPADYTTTETTGGDSVVLAADAQCVPGKYRLVGYKQGDTLQAAESASLSLTAPVYTDITTDKYVIVVNEKCAEAAKCAIGSNLILNGSFETETVNDHSGTWEIFSTVAGWLIGLSDGLEIWNNFDGTDAGLASDGEQNAELDGNDKTRITQPVTLVPGATYELRFDYSPRAGTALADSKMDALLDGATIMSLNVDGSTNTTNAWTSHATTFVATGTSAVVGFEDKGSDNADGGYGPLLDNVSLCMVKEPEPLPTCSLTIKSDVMDYVVEKNAMAQTLSTINGAWVPTLGTSTAAWIWGDNPVATTTIPVTQTFKKGFNWTGGAVTSATLKLASDNSHTVTLGAFSGGNPGEFNYGTTTTYNVMSGITAGANTLAIAVENFGVAGTNAATNPAGLMYELTITGTGKSCGEVVPVVPKTSGAVTMCKVDQDKKPLSGWTLMLLGNKVEDVVVTSTVVAGVNTINTLNTGKSYVAKSTGTWLNKNGANPVDTEYSTTNAWSTQMDGYTGYQNDILELQINSAFDPSSNWGAYNSAHTYAQAFVPVATGTANFRIFDGTGTTPDTSWYTDNAGSLNVAIYEGFSGITGKNGCVTFPEVPFGTYRADEIMQDGWENVSGTGAVGVTYANTPKTIEIVNNKKEIVVEPKSYIIDGFKRECFEDGEYICHKEDTLAGWTITATQGTSTMSTTTNANGYYSFMVGEGTWVVSEKMEPNWIQVDIDVTGGEVSGQSCKFSVGKGSLLSRAANFVSRSSDYQCDFGNYFEEENNGPQTYIISGFKYNDANGSGTKDAGEVGIANWAITAKSGTTVKTATTSLDGSYSFEVGEGEWTVSEESRVGWNQTGVIKNGTAVPPVGEGMRECALNLSVEAFKKNTCDFFNQVVTIVNLPDVPPPGPTPVDNSNNRRSGGNSGTLVANRATPAPLVLGAATGTPACGMYLNDYMRMGNAASTTQVTKLQVFLNAVGITAPLTGIFDSATDAAVRTFQMQHKAEVLTPWYIAKIVPHENSTGWVYQLTRWKINNIVCPGSEAYPVLN